jgi:hypothetical protein
MAVQFSTNGDALTNATNTTFFAASTAPQSVSVWINGLWDGATKTTSMVGMYAPGASAIQIGSRVAAGQCNIWSWGGTIMVSTTGVTIPANTWVNITYTYDGTTHRVYYNGALNNSSTTAQLAGNFTAVYLNGYATGATSETGVFQVDTYDYYNRALSADEIQTIYSARGQRHGIVYGRLLSYDFDEGVQSATVATIYNQTDYNPAISNLGSATAQTPKVTHSAGYVSANMRPPLS